jgi:hypothetical protein
MFLTVETLKRLNACKQGIKYIERFYPNGAELIDIINDKHITKEFLHWGREHLTVNEEELNAYYNVCKISNSEGFWYSHNIQNSKYVVKSKNITGSIGVFESSDVEDSTDVVGSEYVAISHQIFYSSMIDKCLKIHKSSNVLNSQNVCNSTMVARSQSVIDSFNVFDSSEIINSNTISDSHFCQNCKNVKHCMFCFGLEDAEYCIFNKPVDKNHYEVFEQQYKKYFVSELEFIREWPKGLIVNSSAIPTRKFDDWYYQISEKTWKWIRTLPNFEATIIYQITMNPDFL